MALSLIIKPAPIARPGFGECGPIGGCVRHIASFQNDISTHTAGKAARQAEQNGDEPELVSRHDGTPMYIQAQSAHYAVQYTG